MIAYVIISVVTLVLLVLGNFTARRYILGRRHDKAIADAALRKLYGRYWAEVQTVTHKHMLDASADEEWLAEIQARASAAPVKEPWEESAHHGSENVLARSWFILLAADLAVALVVLCMGWVSMSGITSTFVLFLVLPFLSLGFYVGHSGVRREDRRFSRPGPAPDSIARGARRLSGLVSRGSPLRSDDANRA